MGAPDKIEREITIDAPVERVWALVAEPGWWIGDGDRSGQTRTREGDLEIVEDPRYGRFPIRVETVEEPRYVSYRCAFPGEFPGEAPREGNSTLVEFWLAERDGGTVLRVVETGFASLPVSEEARIRHVEGNIEGWTMQLDIARKHAEHAAP